MRSSTPGDGAPLLRDTLRAALRGLPSFLAYGHIGLFGIIDCVMVGPLGVTPLAAMGFAANAVEA